MNNMKPCPFCNGTKTEAYMCGGWWTIDCSHCGISGRKAESELLAIKRWNARPIEDSIVSDTLEIANQLGQMSRYYDHPGLLQQACAAIDKYSLGRVQIPPPQ